MQYTANYNLKKPEGTEPVNVQDLNDNADTTDTELKKRVLASGGDISNTKISTADSISTEFPVPAAGDTPKTFLGKMKKFVEDFKNLKTGLLTVGMLVNNCVTNNANLPLSAAQGKVLMDAITKLNGDLSGFKFIRAISSGLADRLWISNIAGTFALIWYGDRGAGTTGDTNGLILVDATQDKLNYSIVNGTRFAAIALNQDGSLVVAFDITAYWQANVIVVPSLG